MMRRALASLVLAACLVPAAPSLAQQQGGGGFASPLSSAQGGTGAATVDGARLNLYIDGSTPVGNEACSAAFTWNGSQTNIRFTTSLTAPQTCALPAASSVNAGFLINVKDAGAVNGSNIVTVARAGSDTIDGAASLALSVPYGDVVLRSNGSNGWDIAGNDQLAAYTAPANHWINALSASGVFSSAQPGFADLSGSLAATQCPLGTTSAVGCLEVDGSTITVTSGGVASAAATTVNGQTCTPGSACATNSMWGAGCTTLATTATTEYCSPAGTTVASATSTAGTVLAAQNATFTSLYVNLTTAPGSPATHTFTLEINGSNSNLTCEIETTATTCGDTNAAHAASVTAGQTIQINDVTTGTPASSSGRFGLGFHVTN